MKQLDQGHGGGTQQTKQTKKQPNKQKPNTTELGAEASTPMPSQGDEPVFIFLMTLETETQGKDNDFFVLIQGMVCKKKKKKKMPSLQHNKL